MSLPSGIVTFLFTDIEGSTRLWEQHPEAMRVALARHDTLLRHAIESRNGYIFKTMGDAFYAAFADAPHALEAALDAQLALRTAAWDDDATGPLRVRMSLHTGPALERDGDYFGPTLNRVARLQATSRGEQTLLSQATCDALRSGGDVPALPPKAGLRDLGLHRLKDLQAPEHVWQLVHPALPGDFAPLRSLDYLPTNLPRQMTRFIGREQEMREVKRLLPKTPLLTLTGTGGTGKTRLALQVAADVLDAFPGGAWLVELASLSDPVLVPQAVASALGLREEPGRPLAQTLVDQLQSKRLLLVLDNCEHLTDACARLADTLLKACPGLTMLATSREPLGVSGEKPWRVPSLPQPDPDRLPLGEKNLAAVILEYDACRLFLDRAVLARSDFVLTRHNAPSIAAICHRLDGIPLAVELAAARVRALSVEQIAARLSDRFRLLTGGSRTAPPRQQTLRALMDWSYDLLSDTEKTLLRRLSVFAGGWTLPAAEAVCGVGETLDFLTALVDKSLVVFEEQNGAARYRLLETMRQYGRDKLQESGQSRACHTRHRDHFLQFAQEAHTKMNGSEGAQWLDTLEAEHDNLRAALEFCLGEEGDVERGLDLAGSLAPFWKLRGHVREGAHWLTRALGKADAGPTAARATALSGAGTMAYEQGDYQAARARYQESLYVQQERENPKGVAAALSNLGNVAYRQGDTQAARARYEESLAMSRGRGDRWGVASTLGNLGNVAHTEGDCARARVLHEESLALSRALGDQRMTAYTLHNLANVAQSEGDRARARRLYEESLAMKRALGDRGGVGRLLNSLGFFALQQGDYAAAQRFFTEALSLAKELDDRLGMVNVLDGLAWHAAASGQPERAARLWAASAAGRGVLPAPHSPEEHATYQPLIAAARQAATAPAWDAAWARGSALSLEQAAQFVLEEDTDDA